MLVMPFRGKERFYMGGAGGAAGGGGGGGGGTSQGVQPRNIHS